MALNTNGPALGVTIAGIAQTNSQDRELSVEPAAESITAPAVDATATLSKPPLVEGNLTLTSTDSAGVVTTYENGVHYVETPEGFTNLSITAGTALHADYFYYAPGPVSEVSGSGGSGGESSGGGEIDGGRVDSTYLAVQVIDGGGV